MPVLKNGYMLLEILVVLVLTAVVLPLCLTAFIQVVTTVRKSQLSWVQLIEKNDCLEDLHADSLQPISVQYRVMENRLKRYKNNALNFDYPQLESVVAITASTQMDSVLFKVTFKHSGEMIVASPSQP
ncbi:MAG: hypothetical protein AB7F28_04555 [Candidatus Margulisiibacteriota bacterium]